MWLGSLVLIIAGAVLAHKYLRELGSEFKKTLIYGIENLTFSKVFFRLLGLALIDVSPQATLSSSIEYHKKSIMTLRMQVLLMCLSSLGVWLALFLGLLFMNFNGLFLLGICSVGLLSVFRKEPLNRYLKFIFAVGLFLVGGESVLRNSNLILNLLGESDFIFFLADGRLQAVLGLIFFSILVTLFVQIEFWSLFFALSLFCSNILSLNGALGLVIGERIAALILFWWNTKNLNQESLGLKTQFIGVSFLGLIAGLLFVGELRSLFVFEFSQSLTAIQDKSIQLLIFFTLVLFMQWMFQMTWGHFFIKKKVLSSAT
jgi:hypothetical protein